ncbi:CLUMA_CG005828, isoform A [Clunio marinus]|uniref:CLUMA_CG005828, isoform A n=1 Tax=Clunio marinus TaxID=568069 RepID=A0A1J1I1F5_9DIPT|nr:CLUMA_CG005828, isoform A [Clunio marinus]
MTINVYKVTELSMILSKRQACWKKDKVFAAYVAMPLFVVEEIIKFMRVRCDSTSQTERENNFHQTTVFLYLHNAFLRLQTTSRTCNCE